MTVKKGLTISIVILIIVLILYFVLNLTSKDANQNVITTGSNNTEKEIIIKSDEQINKDEIASLKTMTEKERIRTYLSKYLMYIEGGHYEKAYSLLYPDFKENYFQELEEYTKYVKDLYPKTMVLQYGNTERQGKYFIIYVDVVDPLSEKQYVSQRFIVYENDYNDFVISFEVI